MSDLRVELRSQIETTRAAFVALLDRFPSDTWGRPTRNAGWTVGELLFHIAAGVGTTAWNARAALEGRDIELDWAEVDRSNLANVREGVRSATPEDLRARYEDGHARTLSTLESIPDDAWDRSARLYGGVVRTVEGCFRYVAWHFEEHEADLAG